MLVSFWGPAYFQGRLLLVSGRVCTFSMASTSKFQLQLFFFKYLSSQWFFHQSFIKGVDFVCKSWFIWIFEFQHLEALKVEKLWDESLMRKYCKQGFSRGTTS